MKKKKKKKRLKLEVSALEYSKGRKSTRAARLAFNKKFLLTRFFLLLVQPNRLMMKRVQMKNFDSGFGSRGLN